MEVEEQETFQQQALEVREPGENFDPSAPPQNGEEFLMHMVYERKRCPAVVMKPPKKGKVVQTTATTLSSQLEDFQVYLNICIYSSFVQLIFLVFTAESGYKCRSGSIANSGMERCTISRLPTHTFKDFNAASTFSKS